MSATPPPPPPPSTPPPPPPSGSGPIPPPPPFTPGPPQPYGGQSPVARPTSGMATAALVCGIIGLFLFVLFVLPVVALVLGLIAASKAKRSPGPGSGLGRARAGWILGLVGLLGFAGFVVAASVEGFGDDISVGRLEAGDCVDTPDGPTPEDGIEELPERDCDEPHDAEVYLVEDITLDGEDYPGEERVNAAVEEVCVGQGFEDYIGVPYVDSIYGVYTLYPSDQSWDLGDRSAVCMVVSPGGTPLTESVEGSGE